MEMEALQNKIRTAARVMFLCSFVLVSAIACGEFQAANSGVKTTGAARLTAAGTPGTLSAITIGNAKVQGADNTDGSVDFIITNTVTDGERKIDFYLYSTAGLPGDPTMGHKTETVGDTRYRMEAQCNDDLCSVYAVLLSVYDSKANTTIQQAVIYKFNYLTGSISEAKRITNASFDSVGDVLLLPEVAQIK